MESISIILFHDKVQSAENNSPQDLNKSVEKRICKVDITPLNSTHLENQAVGSSTARVLQDLQNKIDSKGGKPSILFFIQFYDFDCTKTAMNISFSFHFR